MSRSRETLGSPPSILATRDWLDLSILASSTWLRLRLLRLFRRIWGRRRGKPPEAPSGGDAVHPAVVGVQRDRADAAVVGHGGADADAVGEAAQEAAPRAVEVLDAGEGHARDEGREEVARFAEDGA